MLPGKTKRCLTNSLSNWPTLKQLLEQMEKNLQNHAMEVIFFICFLNFPLKLWKHFLLLLFFGLLPGCFNNTLYRPLFLTSFEQMQVLASLNLG